MLVLLLVPSRTLSPSSHLIVTNTLVRNAGEALVPESRGLHAVPRDTRLQAGPPTPTGIFLVC